LRNPLRDEASAFQAVWLTLAGAAVVVAASYLSAWLGFIVFLALVAAATWAIRGGLRVRARTHIVTETDSRRRILVVANETVGADELAELLQRRAAGTREDVLVVCPALNSRLRTWTSDEDGARGAAQQRLDASIASLSAAGVSVSGVVGDGDPLQALEDALRTFPADEIVISTHPPGRSHWLERGVVAEAERRYDVPVTHVVSGRV
jgi:nucleotide-binding universal stress UspA family protein